MDKKLLLPGLSLVLGGVGHVLRRRELATAFEPTGLPIPGAPMSVALIGLSLAALAVFFLLAWRLWGGKPPLAYRQAFAFTSPAALTAIVISAMLLLCGGGLGVYSYVNHETNRIAHLMVAVMAIVSGICVMTLGKRDYRNIGNGTYSGLLLVPAFSGCLWLVSVYQVRAGDPIILDYVYQILAIISLVLALYFKASYSFEKGQAVPALWTCCLAVYFSCVTLADGHDWMSLCLHAFAIVYGLLYAIVLSGNLTAEREEPTHEPE